MSCLQRKQTLFFSTLLYTATIILILFFLLYNNGYFKLVDLTETAEGHSITQTFKIDNFNETARRKVLGYDQHTRPKRGYVAALTYSGQQGSGIEAIRSQQCWASTLGMPASILEPVMSRSRLVTDLPNMNSMNVSTSKDRLTFSDFFDTEYYNSVAEKDGLAKLATREEFLHNAPKKIVLVRMDWIDRSIPDEQRHTEVLWPKYSNHKVQGCFTNKDEISVNISRNSSISQLLHKGYCIVKLVSTPHSPGRTIIFSQKDVKDIIYGKWAPNEVTVVFTLWRAIWHVPASRNDTVNSVPSCSTTNPFLPSTRIIKEAEWYESQFLGEKNMLTIMFRLERMVEFFHQTYHHQNVGKNIIGRNVDKCLSKVINVSRDIQRKHKRYRKPFVTLDFGKFGSGSWKQTFSNIGENKTELTIKAKRTLSTLFNNEWSFEEWESSFTQTTNGVDNSGYIAALQRTLASRAECLVLVGGGYFQMIALREYLHQHPDKESRCIHLVCIRDEKLTREIIANYKD